MPNISVDDGPVAVTGASGYVGAHVVSVLMRRGYQVRACVTDLQNPEKTDHLLAMNDQGLAGSVELFAANLLEAGSYDSIFNGASAVLHVGTPMGYGNANNPQEVYDGAIRGTQNVLDSIKTVGSVKRLIYTSSFAAIGHPAEPGYQFTEKDWASDNREDDPNWNLDNLNDKGEVGYAMAKVELEHLVNRVAEEDGRFDSISVCPIVVLGPLLSRAHELVGSWQWYLGRLLGGKVCKRGYQHLWNIVDVRDVAESQALMLESTLCKNGDRYQLSATDSDGELSVLQIKAHLEALYPGYQIGGPPEEIHAIIEKHGQVFQSPLAHCDKARTELGLQTHPIQDTLRDTAESLMTLGLVQAKKH
ncbi:MAG: hypothetical protein CBE21_09750 [Proteobacteria bacterium TMED261]|nr:MAG: hypothetical protein CBE21_09750 [Proteobacteria bacterium TMED261]